MPFQGKPDQTRSSSLEFVAKRSRMNFPPDFALLQPEAVPSAGEDADASSQRVQLLLELLQFGLQAQPVVFHINPLPLTQTSATSNREFLMQPHVKEGWGAQESRAWGSAASCFFTFAAWQTPRKRQAATVTVI